MLVSHLKTGRCFYFPPTVKNSWKRLHCTQTLILFLKKRHLLSPGWKKSHFSCKFSILYSARVGPVRMKIKNFWLPKSHVHVKHAISSFIHMSIPIRILKCEPRYFQKVKCCWQKIHMLILKIERVLTSLSMTNVQRGKKHCVSNLMLDKKLITKVVC